MLHRAELADQEGQRATHHQLHSTVWNLYAFAFLLVLWVLGTAVDQAPGTRHQPLPSAHNFKLTVVFRKDVWEEEITIHGS